MLVGLGASIQALPVAEIANRQVDIRGIRRYCNVSACVFAGRMGHVCGCVWETIYAAAIRGQEQKIGGVWKVLLRSPTLTRHICMHHFHPCRRKHKDHWITCI